MKNLILFLLFLSISAQVFSQEEEETVISTTTSTIQESEILEIEEIDDSSDYKKYEFEEFVFMSYPPVFKGCEKYDIELERRKCTNREILNVVSENFNNEILSGLGFTGIKKITVFFRIDYKGKIREIRSRADHPKLSEEAERIVKLLPKFKPGNKNGNTVNVNHSAIFYVKVLN